MRRKREPTKKELVRIARMMAGYRKDTPKIASLPRRKPWVDYAPIQETRCSLSSRFVKSNQGESEYQRAKRIQRKRKLEKLELEDMQNATG